MLYEVSFLKGFHGIQDSEIVEAIDRDFAELVFEHHFPKKVKYVIEINEFTHNPAWMKPLEEMKIYRNPYPQLDQIDWSKLTMEIVADTIEKVLNPT